jgi:hypothetical protein
MSAMAAYANEIILVTIDGQPVTFANQGPVNVGGRILVPVRGVFEALGFEAEWKGDTQQAVLTKAGDVIIITIDSNVYTTNGISHNLDVPAQLINGNTMLPLRAVLESVGYTLVWDSPANTVVITSGTAAVEEPAAPLQSEEPAQEHGANNDSASANEVEMMPLDDLPFYATSDDAAFLYLPDTAAQAGTFTWTEEWEASNFDEFPEELRNQAGDIWNGVPTYEYVNDEYVLNAIRWTRDGVNVTTMQVVVHTLFHLDIGGHLFPVPTLNLYQGDLIIGSPGESFTMNADGLIFSLTLSQSEYLVGFYAELGNQSVFTPMLHLKPRR